MAIRNALKALLVVTCASTVASQAGTCCPTPRTAHVNAEGRVYVLPDLATVRFHVTAVGSTPQEARVLNERASADILDALNSLVPEERIRQEQLSIQPHFVPVNENDTSKGVTQQGYEATRYVAVEVRNVSLVPQVVGAITREGSGTASVETFLDSVTYGLSDEAAAAASNAALSKAVSAAQTQARTIATALGDTLGAATSVIEGGGIVPRPQASNKMLASEGAGGASDVNEGAYPEGEILVTASVSAEFQLLGRGGGTGGGNGGGSLAWTVYDQVSQVAGSVGRDAGLGRAEIDRVAEAVQRQAMGGVYDAPPPGWRRRLI